MSSFKRLVRPGAIMSGHGYSPVSSSSSSFPSPLVSPSSTSFGPHRKHNSTTPTSATAHSLSPYTSEQQQQWAQDQLGIRLVYADAITEKQSKSLQKAVKRAEKKFRTVCLPQIASTASCGIPPGLIRSSLAQNDIVYTSTGLTLVSFDRLYTFQTALAGYARMRADTRSSTSTTRANCSVLARRRARRREDAVNELRRLMLARRGCVTRVELLRPRDPLGLGPVSEAALREVEALYRRAYGNNRLVAGGATSDREKGAFDGGKDWKSNENDDEFEEEEVREVGEAGQVEVAGIGYGGNKVAEIWRRKAADNRCGEGGSGDGKTRENGHGGRDDGSESDAETEFESDGETSSSRTSVADKKADGGSGGEASSEGVREKKTMIETTMALSPTASRKPLPPLPRRMPRVQHASSESEAECKIKRTREAERKRKRGPKHLVAQSGNNLLESDEASKSYANRSSEASTPRPAAPFGAPPAPPIIRRPVPKSLSPKIPTLQLQTQFDTMPTVRNLREVKKDPGKENGKCETECDGDCDDGDEEESTATPKVEDNSRTRGSRHEQQQRQLWTPLSIAGVLRNEEPASSRVGPMTPNGYDDISPVMRGEWGFLMGARGIRQNLEMSAAAVKC